MATLIEAKVSTKGSKGVKKLAKKPTILLIDDMALPSELYESIFPYRFKVAQSGHLGLETLRTQNETIHLILLDYQMPGLNGLEVLQSIRENYPNIPVWMYTSESCIEEKALAFGAQKLVDKTEEIDKLAMSLDTFFAFQGY